MHVCTDEEMKEMVTPIGTYSTGEKHMEATHAHAHALEQRKAQMHVHPHSP